MPRNPPPIAQPAVILHPEANAEVASSVVFGGAPQLPAELNWPHNDDGPMHFFAQIDLAALPRSMDQAGQSFDMPEFPENGTLFFFCRL